MIGLRPGRLGRRPAPHLPAPTPPPDPRSRGAGAAVADPDLAAIRAGLLPYRRRLWIRRAVRRAWIVGAVAVGAEIVLWALARVAPLEVAPSVGLAIPVVGVAVLGILAARARPSVGETALALDREAGLRDRTASALALAAEPDLDPGFVARQRTDALHVLRSTAPTVFRPPVPLRTAAATVVGLVLLVPLLLLPNPQDQRIADDRRLREEAALQADKVERIADDLAAKARTPDDPRAQVAQQLKDLAKLLRDHPGDLDAALAKVGSVEGELRAQIDPSTEQRAAALASLSRGLSNAAAGRPDANRPAIPPPRHRTSATWQPGSTTSPRPNGSSSRTSSRDSSRPRARPTARPVSPPAMRPGAWPPATSPGRRTPSAVSPTPSRAPTRRSP